MTLAQSHVETFENTVLHKVAVTTNPREGTGKSALNELEMSSG